MNSKVLITIVINFVLLVSMYALFTLITRDESENDDTSRMRFTFLLGLHVVVFFSMLILTKIETTYDMTLWGFCNLAIITTALYICEMIVQGIQRSHHYDYTRFSYRNQRLEVTYLNIYFLLYMYSLIGLIPGACFLVATEGLICWLENHIESNLKRCLKEVSDPLILAGKDCSICLVEYDQDRTGGKWMQIISCGHIFHEICLIQWVKYNTTCPLDRTNVFNPPENNELVEEE